VGSEKRAAFVDFTINHRLAAHAPGHYQAPAHSRARRHRLHEFAAAHANVLTPLNAFKALSCAGVDCQVKTGWLNAKSVHLGRTDANLNESTAGLKNAECIVSQPAFGGNKSGSTIYVPYLAQCKVDLRERPLRERCFSIVAPL
jgi:hypothetical protein